MCLPLVEIGLTDLPKTWGGVAGSNTPVPTAPTALKMVVAFMVVKSWSLCPLPFLLLFAVLFFLMVQLITFEAFLSSLVPLLFFFPAHSLLLVAASNSTARSHLSNFTCRAFCVLCKFLKQMIWDCYLLAVSAIIAQVDLISSYLLATIISPGRALWDWCIKFILCWGRTAACWDSERQK